MKKKQHDGDVLRFLRKTMRIMRLSLFLIVISTAMAFSANSYSQNTKLSLDINNATVKEVIKAIENQSEFLFFYQEKHVDLNRQVTLHATEQDVETILNRLFAETDNIYVINDRQIVLGVAPRKELERQMVRLKGNVKSVIDQPQQKEITGKVTDDDGLPLPGVSVIVKGTTIGTVTNADGEFSLNIPLDAETLQFSFVGMRTQDVPIEGRTTFTVVMEGDVIGIEEVVAVGYGTMKKSDLTGSVASISSESFLDQPASSPNSILAGKAPGLVVSSSNGAPGQGDVIRIRGANSLLGNNSPLFVTDGTIGVGASMYEIESIEILKDASATAIYGSRGANGVILITTKRGTEGKPTVEIHSDISFSITPQRYDLMGAYEFAEFNKSTGAYPFTDAEIAKFKEDGGIDWQDEIFQGGISQSYRAIISGGSKNVRYHISPSYGKTTGIVRNTESSGYGLKAKLDIDLSDRITIQIEPTIGYSDNLNPNLATGGTKTENPLVASVIWAPTEPMYEEDLTFNLLGVGSSTVRNPVLLTETIETNYSHSARGVGNLQFKITDELTLDAKGVISHSTGGGRDFQNEEYTGVAPVAEQNSRESKSWLVNTFFTYSNTIADVHNLSAMAGMEETKSESQSLMGEATELPFGFVRWYNLGIAAPNIKVGSGYGKSAMRSHFGRLNYDYDSRYYLTMNYRADGSSRFIGDNQFGYFPSFSLAWRLSNEKFMKSQNVFQNVKIRGGWGVTGSQSGGATYTALNGTDYTWGGINRRGYRNQSGGNPNLKWESTKQLNLGIDLVTIGNRLFFTFDYYNKKTEDLLAPVTVPAYNGGGTVISNVGSVRNKGYEINIDYYVSRTNEFSYNINLNGSINRNKVLDIGEQEMLYGEGYAADLTSRSPFILTPGEPIGTIYGMRYLGIWQENEAEEAAKFQQEPGDYKYEDLNGNDSYDTEDKQVIGNTNPSITGGVNNHVSYKNFDLNILFEGVLGRDVMNWAYMVATHRIDFTQTYTLRAAKDRWTPENSDAEFAKIGNTNRLNPLSSQFVQSGDYLKLRNISLSYRIPKRVIPFANIKLAVSAQNLLTLTKYKGYDPEISSASGSSYDANSGMDWFAYPNPQSFSFRISLEY